MSNTYDSNREAGEIDLARGQGLLSEDFNTLSGDVDARQQLLDALGKARYSDANPNRSAAAWRLRVARQRAIISELKKLGDLAVLSGGSLLITYTGGSINLPERYPGWRKTLEESPLMDTMNSVQRAQLIGAKHNNWTRIEEALRNFGNCLCLAVKQLNDKVICEGFNNLKVHILQRAFASDYTTDKYIEYLKWLGKATQFALLNERAEIPDETILDKEGHLLPYVGKLSYISDMILSYQVRKEPLTYESCRQLSQMAQVPRSMPYPSKDQARESVKETMAVATSTFKPSLEALNRHRQGLQRSLEHCKLRPNRTHVSLTTSGRLESSRAHGGGAPHLITATRRYTDQLLDLEAVEPLVGKFDQFGEVILSHATFDLAKVLLRRNAYTVTPTLGDILFVKVEELEQLWDAMLFAASKRVPPKLGKLLNLTASLMIRQVGEFNPQPEMHMNVMCFSQRIVRFSMTQDYLEVKAAVSIEKGLKTRVVTSAMTAFSHLSQLPANYMRELLSQDPFLKTGMDEPDKLWQVLKAYKSKVSKEKARADS